MADTTKPKRFYFCRDQLVVIALAFVMSAAIILVLGMITGKTIARRGTVERTVSVVKIPFKPPPATADSAPEAQPGKSSVSEKESTKAAAAQPGDKESAKADTTKPTPPVKEPAKMTPQVAAEKSGEKAAKKESPDQIWTVQVKSSTDKAFADRWVERLQTKGHDAFTVEADVKGQIWYRVRVGHLDTRQEAEILQRALESQEGLSGTFLLKTIK